MAELSEVVLDLVAKPMPSATVTIPDRWWSASGPLDRALELLRKHDLWPQSLAVARRAETGQEWRFHDADELFGLARGWVAGFYRFTADDPEAPTRIDLDLDRATLGFRITYGGAELDSRRATLPTAAAKAAVALASAIHPAWALLPGSLFADELRYPRHRPPIYRTELGPGALVHVIDLARFRARAAGGWGLAETVTELETAAAAPLPPGAERFVDADAFAIQWVESLSDPALVRAQLMAEEDWLLQHLPVERDSSFNDAGDQVIAAALVPTPPFTLYDPGTQLACLAVGAWSDGRVDPADERALTALRAAPPLPITRLAAIVHGRDVALATFDRLRRAGADTVLYPSDDGRALWDPFPPGLWRAPS